MNKHTGGADINNPVCRVFFFSGVGHTNTNTRTYLKTGWCLDEAVSVCVFEPVLTCTGGAHVYSALYSTSNLWYQHMLESLHFMAERHIMFCS